MIDNSGIYKALAAVINATGGKGSGWTVGGSAGLLLRKLPLQASPRDLDVYCDDEDTHLIYDLLKPYAVDEPAESITDMYRSRLCHFIIHDVQVELVGGFEVTAKDSFYRTEVKRLLIPFGDRLDVEGSALAANVVPLAHELWFNALRDRTDRVDLIADAFRDETDGKALQAIEAANRFSEHAKLYVRSIISARKAGRFH